MSLWRWGIIPEFGILHNILGVFMWGSEDNFLTRLPDHLAFFKGSSDMHFEKKVLLSHMDIWTFIQKEVLCVYFRGSNQRAILNKSIIASFFCVKKNVNSVVQLIIPDLHAFAILKSIIFSFCVLLNRRVGHKQLCLQQHYKNCRLLWLEEIA